MEKLTLPEEQAMQVVWKIGEGHVKAFLEHFPEPRPPYTTLASTLKNLEKKGFVRSRLVGNSYLYKAAIREEDYKKKNLSGLVEHYFDNSYKNLVNFFVANKKVSAEELKEIIRLIEGENK